MAASKLRLPSVTVCSADCLHPELAARALEKCVSGIDFGDAVLFSDREVRGGFRWQPIAPLKSSDDYSRFCLREMVEHISTPFALVVQWDGYVVDPGAWRQPFLQYDYIGAPWSKNGAVGNGGFSLRSRRLLEALRSIPLLPGYPEDWIICRGERATLEQRYGIRFPSPSLASQFSYEELPPAERCFGFHGVYNLRHHETDAELVRIATGLGPRERASWPFFSLILNCMRDGRVDAAIELYALSRRDMSMERVIALASTGPLAPQAIAIGARFLESRLAARRTGAP